MKANVFAVSIPTPPCKFKCPYCISEMTFPVIPNEIWFNSNLQKAVKLAERLNVSHCLITAKGEPLDNPKMLKKVLYAFSDFFIEIQVHWSYSYFKPSITDMFYDAALNVLSISIDKPAILHDPVMWGNLTTYPWIKRAAIVLTDKFKGWTLMDFIKVCKENNIQQLTIRNPTVPVNFQTTEKSLKVVDWINKNVTNNLYVTITREFLLLKEAGKANPIRDLQFGANVYDVEGIGFVYMDYCVEEQNGEIIRSLIYQSDGHIYTTWDYPGSIMF